MIMGFGLNNPGTGSNCSEKVLRIMLDTGDEAVLHILTETELILARRGEPFRKFMYRDLSRDTRCRLLFFGEENSWYTWLICEEQQLATLVISEVFPTGGESFRQRIYPGAIRVFQKETPFLRHGFTDMLVGEKIAWQFSPRDSILTYFVNESYIRAALLSDEQWAEDCRKLPSDLAGLLQPMLEEPAEYLKIAHGLFLICVSVRNRTRIDPECSGLDAVFVLDIEALQADGRILDMRGAFHPFSVCGRRVLSAEGLETAESPYLI